ncbi:MAG: CoA-binding protein [Deltaproteobacteria bacterium]|nr:CoA-binding protein [Deltaproteobacteria bacterium]
MLTDDHEIQQILLGAVRVAVVGASHKPQRPSHQTMAYLLQQGYQVVPVNPAGGEILGQPVARSLREIQRRVDIVDVFRNPGELQPTLVDEALAVGAKLLWLQDGVIREDIARLAIERGLLVVMDDCIKRRHAHLDYCEIPSRGDNR